MNSPELPLPSDFAPNVPTLTMNLLGRHGITPEQADSMPDADLLALHGFGNRALEWFRSTRKLAESLA